MFIKVNDMFFNIKHIVAVEDCDDEVRGKVRIYVFGLKKLVYTNDFVSARSFMEKVVRIQRNGESSL